MTRLLSRREVFNLAGSGAGRGPPGLVRIPWGRRAVLRWRHRSGRRHGETRTAQRAETITTGPTGLRPQCARSRGPPGRARLRAAFVSKRSAGPLCPHPSRRQRQRRKGHRSFVEEGRGGGPGVACTRISGQDLGRGAGAVSGPTSPSSIDPLSMCSSAMPSIRATLRFRLLGRRLLRPFHGDHQRRPLQSLHRPLAGVFGAGRTAGPWAATDRRAAA